MAISEYLYLEEKMTLLTISKKNSCFYYYSEKGNNQYPITVCDYIECIKVITSVDMDNELYAGTIAEFRVQRKR